MILVSAKSSTAPNDRSALLDTKIGCPCHARGSPCCRRAPNPNLNTGLWHGVNGHVTLAAVGQVLGHDFLQSLGKPQGSRLWHLNRSPPYMVETEGGPHVILPLSSQRSSPQSPGRSQRQFPPNLQRCELLSANLCGPLHLTHWRGGGRALEAELVVELLLFTYGFGGKKLRPNRI